MKISDAQIRAAKFHRYTNLRDLPIQFGFTEPDDQRGLGRWRFSEPFVKDRSLLLFIGLVMFSWSFGQKDFFGQFCGISGAILALVGARSLFNKLLFAIKGYALAPFVEFSKVEATALAMELWGVECFYFDPEKLAKFDEQLASLIRADMSNTDKLGPFYDDPLWYVKAQMSELNRYLATPQLEKHGSVNITVKFKSSDVELNGFYNHNEDVEHVAEVKFPLQETLPITYATLNEFSEKKRKTTENVPNAS